MESIDLDMNDLFEQDAGTLEEEIDGDLNPLSGNAAFPDLDAGEVPGGSDGEGENNAAENEDEEGAQLNRLRDLSKGAAKKRVQRPQPKLDSTRLKGDRGLPILMKVFQDVKFKGRGCEAQDLKLMMGKLEHWAHRLFPKVPFDEFIERLEKLGAKKDVQNCVRRIRLDMPILNEDYVTQYDDEEETKKDGDPEEEDAAAAAAAGGEEDEMDAEQAFEEMMQREHELYCKEKEQLEKETGASSINRQRDAEENDDSVSGSQSQIAPPPKTPPGSALPKPVKTPASMSAEQKARMEENKMKALKKRAARLGVPVSQLMSPKPAPPKENEASKEGSQPRSPLKSCDLEDGPVSQPIQEEDAASRLQPEAASSTDEQHNEESSTQETEKPTASQEDDQQTEEDLMLALEMDTDESFTKDSHSDTGGKSPRGSFSSRSKSQALTKDGHKENSLERTESQQNGVDSEDMSEEFSLITNKKDAAEVNGENENSADLMSEEFSVIRGKKPATKPLQNHNELLSEDMETEELSEVLQVVNNNVAKDSKDKEQRNGDSEVDMEQIDSLTNMDSDSVPLI